MSAQRLFVQFCILLNVPTQAPAVDDLGAYAELLLQVSLAAATVKTHLSAVKQLVSYSGTLLKLLTFLIRFPGPCLCVR